MIIKLSEKKEKDIINKILLETFYPCGEKVMAIKSYLDKNFKKSIIDDIGEDGYPIKANCALMMGINNQPLKTVQPKELLLILNDKFPKIIVNDLDRQKFFKQVLIDWFNGEISSTGILSVNSIK